MPPACYAGSFLPPVVPYLYLYAHISRLNLGASELHPGCGSFVLLSVRFCSICYVVFLVSVLVLYFFVLKTNPGSASQLRRSHLWF